MYLDSGTLLAISIALIGQMVLLLATVRHAFRMEQAYKDTYRLLKMERANR